MIHPGLPLSLFALLAPVTAGAWDDFADMQFAQVTIHQRVVIRVTSAPASAARVMALQPIRWKEKKGPKCVAASTLASAAISSGGDVDLIVTDGRRLRAKLDDDCPSLNFYSGFYLKQAKDGKVCAGRDMLRTRSGGHCEISRFRTLVEKKRD